MTASNKSIGRPTLAGVFQRDDVDLDFVRPVDELDTRILSLRALHPTVLGSRQLELHTMDRVAKERLLATFYRALGAEPIIGDADAS